MLARHLGLPVTVYQPHSALVLDAASLAVPVVNADARLLDLLRRYADELLARRARKDDLVARAERWILENLHTGQVGVAQLARGLGMSDRTLARRLAEDGLKPAGLVEELRQQLANKYLAERAFPLGRITYLLGYSDLSAFTRAFRRWTGRTPSKWRAELLHTPQPPSTPLSTPVERRRRRAIETSCHIATTQRGAGILPIGASRSCGVAGNVK